MKNPKIYGEFKYKLSYPTGCYHSFGGIACWKNLFEAIVKGHLTQLNKVQSAVNGATKVFEKEALDLARKLDQTGDKTLPLFGLPCNVKETFAPALVGVVTNKYLRRNHFKHRISISLLAGQIPTKE